MKTLEKQHAEKTWYILWNSSLVENTSTHVFCVSQVQEPNADLVLMNYLLFLLFFWEDDSWQILLILEAFFITPLQKKISILKDVIVASLTLIHFVNVIIFIFFSCIQYIFHYLQNKYSFSICSVRSRQIYSLILMKNDFSHWTCLILWLAWSGNMHKFSERLKYPPSQSSDSYPLQ
jgi:flagellar biosynthesis protein FlhB